MDDLRVPKRPVSVEVLLPGAGARRMALYLAGAAVDHEGPERPRDLLEGGLAFIPALDEESGAMTFLHRRGLLAIRVDRALDADEEEVTLPTEHEVEVLLDDGTLLPGLVSYVRPPDRSRLLDVLGEAPAFLRLLQGDQVTYVNTRHVVRVALASR